MRKYKIIIMLVAMIAIAGIASAQSTSTSTIATSTPPAPTPNHQPGNMLGNNSQNEDMGMGDRVKADKNGRLMRGGKEVVLTVASNGDTTLRGVVTAVTSGSSLSVKTWGGVWTIDISKLPVGFQQNDASKIAVGDFVGVNGIMDQTTQIVVAKIARVWDPSKPPMQIGDNRSGTSTQMMPPPRRDGQDGTSTNMMPQRREGQNGTSTSDRQEVNRDGRRLPPPLPPQNNTGARPANQN